MQFKELAIGQQFDFVGPDRTAVSFTKRCTKKSARKYVDEDGQEHTVGAVSAAVYNVSPVVEPPPLNEANKANFETLRRACDRGNLALMSAVRKADNKPVGLVCAISSDGKEYVVTPLAVMIEGNPYEDFLDPT